MAGAMSVQFLGTSSGGGPTLTRNCSSLIVDALSDGSLWMVDCAEGTSRQFQFLARDQGIRISQLSKMFITHMHADHIMGIVPLLRNLLLPPPLEPNPSEPEDPTPSIELYGPSGIRNFVRTVMSMTFSKTARNYVVHELLAQDDPVTLCTPDDLHANECPGRDIYSDKDGFWRSITSVPGAFGDVHVDAGPIIHRAPSLGFIVRESVEPFRKIAILGDTNDPHKIAPLCMDPSPSLLIHEATDAYIPPTVDYKSKRSPEVVQEKNLGRGHSSPAMAGSFAKLVGAQKLVLNHIGGRFPAPQSEHDRFRRNVITEIERQASEAWGMGNARAAWDFMSVVVPAVPLDNQQANLQDGSQNGTSNIQRGHNHPQRAGHHNRPRGQHRGFHTGRGVHTQRGDNRRGGFTPHADLPEKPPKSDGQPSDHGNKRRRS